MLTATRNNPKMATAAIPTSISSTPAKSEVPAIAAPTQAVSKGTKRMRTKEANTELKEKQTSTKELPPANSAPAETEEKVPETGNYVIVHKAVRAYLKTNVYAMHCGSDAIPAINAKVQELLDDGCKRAHGNGRKTLKACDF